MMSDYKPVTNMTLADLNRANRERYTRDSEPPLVTADDFKESEHPRRDDGKFGSGGGEKKEITKQELEESMSGRVKVHPDYAKAKAEWRKEYEKNLEGHEKKPEAEREKQINKADRIFSQREREYKKKGGKIYPDD